MEFSNGELTVMQMLWDGECLDENGEIQALELFKLLNEKFGYQKTSCYTFFGRLLDKGAISRREPKYTIKPAISRDEALRDQQEEAIQKLFQGSFVNVFRAFLDHSHVSQEELQEMKDFIKNFEIEE
ncbi:BlaI/MecI/CopY family transcriptional regulator [Guggenheimella bovis]